MLVNVSMFVSTNTLTNLNILEAKNDLSIMTEIITNR